MALRMKIGSAGCRNAGRGHIVCGTAGLVDTLVYEMVKHAEDTAHVSAEMHVQIDFRVRFDGLGKVYEGHTGTKQVIG